MYAKKLWAEKLLNKGVLRGCDRLEKFSSHFCIYYFFLWGGLIVRVGKELGGGGKGDLTGLGDFSPHFRPSNTPAVDSLR
jgi:hypothetical protein